MLPNQLLAPIFICETDTFGVYPFQLPRDPLSRDESYGESCFFSNHPLQPTGARDTRIEVCHERMG